MSGQENVNLKLRGVREGGGGKGPIAFTENNFAPAPELKVNSILSLGMLRSRDLICQLFVNFHNFLVLLLFGKLSAKHL